MMFIVLLIMNKAVQCFLLIKGGLLLNDKVRFAFASGLFIEDS